MLQPGDVLYVPKHWWHYVQALDTAMSVNQWVDVPSDAVDRLQEAVVRFLVSAVKTSQQCDGGGPGGGEGWLNPTEEHWGHAGLVGALHRALGECGTEAGDPGALTDVLLRCLTQRTVVEDVSLRLISMLRFGVPVAREEDRLRGLELDSEMEPNRDGGPET